MPSNIAIKITADVADLTAKRAVMSAELKAATKDLNDLAKASKNGMTDELKAKMLEAATAVAKTRAEMAQLNAEMAKLGKEGNAAALANVWGAAKSNVLEEGAAKLGVLGAGLEALGPQGLVAAGGIAAVAAAFEGVEKTAEWAEQLERASATLGLTTSRLQEFDFVATATGIPVDRMRESMGGLERTIGLVESGLARSIQTKAFTDGLHISPEDLRGWGDLEHQLPHIVEALSKLDPEERAAIAQRLKVDPEVITALVSAKDRLGDLIEEAHKYGIVMDEEAVKKSAEAAEKLHVMGAVIEGETRVAFANLAPAVSTVAGALTHLVGDVADVARGVGVVLEPLGGLAHVLGGVPAVAHATGDALINMIPGLRQIVDLLGLLKQEGEEARKTADLKGLIDQYVLNPEEKPKPQKLSDGNTKGPSVVAQWTEQLHAQEIASGEFFKDQTANELAFWQGKLALTKQGSKEWLEVQSKIYEAQKTLAHQAYDEHLAALNDQLAADRDNWSKAQADWNAKLDFIKAHYGAESKEYLEAHKAFQDAERQHQRQMAEIAHTGSQQRLEALREDLKAEAEIRKANASAAEAQINQNAKGSASPIAEVTAAAQIAALHRQLGQQEIADAQAMYAKEDALRQEDIARARAVYGQDSAQYAQSVAAKEKADNQFYNQRRVMEAQLVAQSQQDALKVQQQWTNAVSPVVRSFGSGIEGMIKGTETLTQALENVGETILNVIIEAIERWVTAQIVAMITGQAAGKAAAASQVATAVGLAGANGVASMALAPFPLDLTAPAFGASMAAAAAGLGAIASFDVGTNYVPSDMVAQIHAGERIIPAADNSALMAAVGGGGSGGGDSHFHGDFGVTINGGSGMDGRTVVKALEGAQGHFARLLRGMHRGGHFAFAKG